MVYAADRNRFPLGTSRIGEIQAETYNYLLYVKSDTQIYGAARSYLEVMAKMPKDGILG